MLVLTSSEEAPLQPCREWNHPMAARLDLLWSLRTSFFFCQRALFVVMPLKDTVIQGEPVSDPCLSPAEGFLGWSQDVAVSARWRVAHVPRQIHLVACELAVSDELRGEGEIAFSCCHLDLFSRALWLCVWLLRVFRQKKKFNFSLVL